MPKVTVLMPVYNAADYVKEAIDSILNQTFDDFEFLIFNDGSTDSSADIVKSYKDQRIKFYDYAQNQGYVHHLNYGIEIAKGEYIARMDADDISLPRRFEKQVEFMDTNPEVGASGTWYKIIGSGNEIKYPTDSESIRLALLDYCALGHPTVMLRSSVFKESSLRYEQLYCPAEDYFLWSLLAENYELANLPEILLHYRVHTAQISNYQGREQADKSYKIRKRQIEKLISRLMTDIEDYYYQLMIPEIIQTSYKVELGDFLRWINLLKHSNHEKELYSAKYFDEWLSNHLIRILNLRESELLNQINLQLVQLNKSEIELQQSRDMIAAIKSSKFWKLRQVWFKFKNLLNIK